MKKRLLLVLAVLLFVLGGCAPAQNTEPCADALRFLAEYEALNGQKNDNGKLYPVVEVMENNPMFYATTDEIVRRIEAKENFLVYFGFAECPWCRGCLEPFLASAQEHGIDQICYVDIQNERDKFELQDGRPVRTEEGTAAYTRLLELLEPVLSDYLLTDDAGIPISTGEKRIYAPNYVAIVDGKPVALAKESELQADPYAELAEEAAADLEQQFENLFQKFR